MRKIWEAGHYQIAAEAWSATRVVTTRVADPHSFDQDPGPAF
jgi:hypothetical protein